MSIQTFDL